MKTSSKVVQKPTSFVVVLFLFLGLGIMAQGV